MNINKHKYPISVSVFIIFASLSLVQAWLEHRADLVAMLFAVIGFFVFMVVDRIEQAATIENLQLTIQQLVVPLNGMRAEHLLKISATDTSCFECQRLSSTKGFEYCISKIKSARQMYNTSFSTDISILSGGYYDRWLHAIVEGITEHDCIVREVTQSKGRLSMLRHIFQGCGKPMKGSYIGFDLSSKEQVLRTIPFVEFCIFENQDDSIEIVFGWASSNEAFLGSDCFVAKDKHVATYFLSYLRRIELLGEPASLDAPKTEHRPVAVQDTARQPRLTTVDSDHDG